MHDQKLRICLLTDLHIYTHAGQSNNVNSPAMNSHWQIWLVSQQQPPSVNPFFAMLWQPPLQPPIPSPGDYDGIVQQTPGSGRSVPSRYQTNHGRRLAAAPYQQPLNHESLGSIREDHPTDTYPGMAHTSTSGSGTGRVRRRRPAIDEDEPHCWVQFGTDHAGRWSVPEESRTDSVDSLEYEVLYEDPERMLTFQSIPY